MKTIFKILIVALIFISSNILTAQTFETLEDNELSGFNTQASEENFLLNQSAANLNSTSSNNAIFIAQIGDNNDAVSVTRSTQSNVNIIQNGNDNLTVLDINSTKIVETVIQNGDNNSVFDHSPFKTDLKNTTINQTGNNQNLTMFGSNSLSEKIKVSMQGQDQSIIIRNF